MDLILSLFKLKKTIKNGRLDGKFAEKLIYFEEILETQSDCTDQDISQLIYKRKNISSAFRSLKYRMEEKLMNDVFLLSSDEEKLKSRLTAQLVIEKMALVGLSFTKYGFRKDGLKVMEKSLKLSKKYNFTDLILKLLFSILNHYSFTEPDPKVMNKILSDIDFYSKLNTAENYVRKCNAIISHMYVMNKGGLNKTQLAEVRTMILKMQDIKKEYNSNTIVVFANDLTYFYYQSIGDYATGLEIATNALKEILELNNYEILGVYQHKMNIAVCNFCLKNYSIAGTWFSDVLGMVSVGNQKWFHTTSLYYLNLACQKNFKEVFTLSIKVLANKDISKYPYYQELWKIREAYLHFLIRIEKIELTPDEKSKMKPFSLSRFMNSVPFHSKDKSGQNITILVLQILFLLEENKYGQIIDRIDALTQYTYRYLRNDETFRSNCFIKMLLLMIKADFHPIRTKTYTVDLKKKLDNSHLITDEKSTQVEIIPYDYLWELILEMLEKKKSKS